MFEYLKCLDILIMATYLLVAIKNPKALIMVLLAVNYFIHFDIKISNFQLFCFVCFYQFLAAITNIDISSTFRKVLFLQGVIYFISACNELLTYQANIRTNWPAVMPMFITLLDLYIINILLSTGGYGRKRTDTWYSFLVSAGIVRLLCFLSTKEANQGRGRT
jgi:hypothetical protein